jgi:hypothetical protein
MKPDKESVTKHRGPLSGLGLLLGLRARLVTDHELDRAFEIEAPLPFI